MLEVLRVVADWQYFRVDFSWIASIRVYSDVFGKRNIKSVTDATDEDLLAIQGLRIGTGIRRHPRFG